MMDRAKYDKLSRGDKMLDMQIRQNERVDAENRLGSAKDARTRNVQERGQPPAIYDAEVTRRQRMLQDAQDRESYKDITRKFAGGGLVGRQSRGFGKARRGI